MSEPAPPQDPRLGCSFWLPYRPDGLEKEDLRRLEGQVLRHLAALRLAEFLHDVADTGLPDGVDKITLYAHRPSPGDGWLEWGAIGWLDRAGSLVPAAVDPAWLAEIQGLSPAGDAQFDALALALMTSLSSADARTARELRQRADALHGPAVLAGLREADLDATIAPGVPTSRPNRI